MSNIETLQMLTSLLPPQDREGLWDYYYRCEREGLLTSKEVNDLLRSVLSSPSLEFVHGGWKKKYAKASA